MGRREINVFSVSFLDCIFCGFGAVVLLFVIINARAANQRIEQDLDLRADVDRLQLEVLDKKKDLLLIRNSLESSEAELVRTEGLAIRVEKDLEEKKVELADYEDKTLASKDHINSLKADMESLEKAYKRLKTAGVEAAEGTKVKSFVGDGDRQYLTGMKMGGKRILILVDASASMLGRQIVDVIIRRNLPDEAKRSASKWQNAIATVDWLTSQLPPGSRFQIYTFNEEASPLLPKTKGTWLETSDLGALNDSIESLRRLVPRNGTSLHAAFEVIETMEPKPDNLFLLVDSLPTIGQRKSRAQKISANTRLRHFHSAIRKLPMSLPVNVVLFPMEGDPMAASSYWRLAMTSKGSFFSPSEDWP